jgi:alpha-glucosidase
VDSGIGAIWLSPINQSPMIDFGYDISDFRNIDKIFGTSRDFEELVKRAKELGVRVIIVTNEEGSYFHINLHS